MKSIVALIITGLLASTAALAQDSKMAAPAAPAATQPSAESPTGDQPAKKSAHHKKKKAHKSSMAKAEGDTKSGMKSTTEPTKPEAASSEMKK
jgi:basic membrane lipoprotein Med (substrate-binding protein (PBP1-ABC) superfamily)